MFIVIWWLRNELLRYQKTSHLNFSLKESLVKWILFGNSLLVLLSDAVWRLTNWICGQQTQSYQDVVNASSGIPDSKVHGANMGPIWADRTQVGPMLASWTLLSGYCFRYVIVGVIISIKCVPYVNWITVGIAKTIIPWLYMFDISTQAS